MKDFYYILGTDHNATPIEIREAYKKLSKKFHPDLNQNDYYFENQFKEISEAYNTLNDPLKRKRYDVSLKYGDTHPAKPEIKKQAPLLKGKYIDIVFSIILMLITCLFGYYVYNAVFGIRKTTPKLATIVAPPQPTKHRKRKHTLKITSAETVYLTRTPTNVKTDTPKVNAVKSGPVIAAVVTPKTTLPTIRKSNAEPLQNNNDQHESNITQPPPSNFYTAYIRANATGIVYLRKLDNYNSDVVSNIPNNAKVTVLAQGKTFCKVSFNNETGYVPKWTLLTK